MAVIILPGLSKAFGSSAYEGVRAAHRELEVVLIGKTVSHYKILEKLGEGSMGWSISLKILNWTAKWL